MPELNDVKDKNVNSSENEGDDNAPDTVSKADYDKLKSEFDNISKNHAQFEGLYNNPRFEQFLQEENRRLVLGDDEYDKMYGQSSRQVDDDADTDDNDVDPHVSELMSEVKALKEKLAQKHYDDDQARIQKDLDELNTNTTKYPLFKSTVKRGDEDVPVKQLMIEEMQKAVGRGQDMSYEQAYKIVTYDAAKDLGRREYEEVLAKKRDAARVGAPVTSQGRKDSSPKKYDNPRQAVEDALNDLQL